MRGTTQREALEFFDSLEAVESDFMKGLWKGSEMPSGHPMDGLLTLVPWYGKRFVNAENVHPLVMIDKQKRLYSVNPDLLLKFAEMSVKLKMRSEMKNAHIFDGFLKIFTTKKSKARLREVKFRGVMTAAMIYDNLKIIDIFRKVDENTVLGVMDFKGRMHETYYFFVLRRK